MKDYPNIQFMAGIIQFNYVIVIIAVILALSIVYLFYYGLDNQLLNVIKAIKGLQESHAIGINDQN
jgi:uncharacterized membrane protein (DUF106 family)